VIDTNSNKNKAPVDHDELALRRAVVDKIIRLQTEQGLATDARWRRLCEQFVERQLDDHQLTYEIMRPYLC
jgi:hypothetical protein